MFYIINSSYVIVSSCSDEEKIVSNLEDCINNLPELKEKNLKVHKLDTFSDVVKSGVYYRSKDGVYELREYDLCKGFIYNALYYRVVDSFHISAFETKNDSPKIITLDTIKKRAMNINITGDN
jgi:hypothetical protein